MSHTIPADLIKALPHGVSVEDCTITTVAALDADHDIDVDIDAVIGDAPALVLPGWYADDGGAEIHIPDADSGEDAARQYVEGGDWGDERNRTDWVDVWAWRRALALDENQVITIEMDRSRHTIEIEPDEPECEHADGHDWHERGVRGHGGGVEITHVCAHCGRYMIVDTWAQRPDTGEQGLRSVEYREPDESSRDWVEARRLDAADDRLTAAGYDTRLDRERRVVVVAAGELDDDGADDEVDALEDRLGDDYIVTWSRDDDGDVRLYVHAVRRRLMRPSAGRFPR